ncbi:hypothetical protein Y032_0044g965 [Ancylostoma ceylanicum]|uniref:Uncharacterized protein n=1 Tax=Ancylostoma ceylanicum TaxID=53326 RepID=A0A016UFJ8_9BILA|nr:hypothetical protein Y032_0044g965 [Ancylostoma ceylanicum]
MTVRLYVLSLLGILEIFKGSAAGSLHHQQNNTKYGYGLDDLATLADVLSEKTEHEHTEPSSDKRAPKFSAVAKVHDLFLKMELNKFGSESVRER